MISERDVVSFKKSYCDENPLIAALLADRLAQHFVDPIVDVGAGMGDILKVAFPKRRVTQLDILDYSRYPIAPTHSRERIDFFQYAPVRTTPIGTLLFCHVLQFLDDDIDRLNAKIAELNPVKIATVLNCNDSFMGRFLSWSRHYLPESNPEIDHPDFPDKYLLEEEVTLTATVSAPDFPTLAQQVCYLVDCRPTPTQSHGLTALLQEALSQTSFPINQRIRIYGRP